MNDNNITQDLHHYCENNKWALISYSKNIRGFDILYMTTKGNLRFGFVQEPKQIRFLKKKYGN